MASNKMLSDTSKDNNLDAPPLGQLQSEKATLLHPLPPDPTKSPIENTLELTELREIEPDIFTNTRPPWHPVRARGIFGGGVIAQSITAGQLTVPPNFHIHSCHCYFLLAGTATAPLIYHVERVRDGRSFATRTVQARQRGACIFTITMSFVRPSPPGTKALSHAVPAPPKDGRPPLPANDDDDDPRAIWDEPTVPYIIRAVRLTGELDKPGVHQRHCQHWMKARGTISKSRGAPEHAAALAYLSDGMFAASVPRIHGVWRFQEPPEAPVPDHFKATFREDVGKDGLFNGRELHTLDDRPRIGMLVSLDHSIYFHNPQAIKADEWMLSDVRSPFSGDGRGTVISHIYSKEGMLLATCTQEGVTRLRQDGPEPMNPDIDEQQKEADRRAREAREQAKAKL